MMRDSCKAKMEEVEKNISTAQVPLGLTFTVNKK